MPEVGITGNIGKGKKNCLWFVWQEGESISANDENHYSTSADTKRQDLKLITQK